MRESDKKEERWRLVFCIAGNGLAGGRFAALVGDAVLADDCRGGVGAGRRGINGDGNGERASSAGWMGKAAMCTLEEASLRVWRWWCATTRCRPAFSPAFRVVVSQTGRGGRVAKCSRGVLVQMDRRHSLALRRSSGEELRD